MNSKEIAILSEKTVKKFKEVEVILDKECTLQERDMWLKHLKQHIRLCNKAIRDADLSIGTRRKLQSNVGHLKRFKKVIENLSYIGTGLLEEKRSNRVKWEEIASIFQGRVRTGIIINLKHKDVNQFFDDAFYLFKNRVKHVLRKMSMLKVNTCFCGEFIRKSGDFEIIEKKYFNTKNQIIDAGTDLKQWFEVNVKDDIFNALSEFSESGSGWALDEILSLEVNFNKYEVGNGVASSYIRLPPASRRKEGKM